LLANLAGYIHKEPRMASLREYETTYILLPDADAAQKAQVAERVKAIIEGQFGGELLRSEEWGRRQLAYPIRKLHHGVYVYTRYTAAAEAIAELERILRLLDPVLKFLTVRLETGEASDARPDMVRAISVRDDDDDEEEEEDDE